jgi:hypothetical protein
VRAMTDEPVGRERLEAVLDAAAGRRPRAIGTCNASSPPTTPRPGTVSVTMSRDNLTGLRQEQTFTWPTLPNPFGTSNATSTGPIDTYVTHTEEPSGGHAAGGFFMFLG